VVVREERSAKLCMMPAWLTVASLPKALQSAFRDPFVRVEVVTNDGRKSSVRLPDTHNTTCEVDASALSPTAGENTVADSTRLLHLSEATVLANLVQRYMANEPYTYTGEILTSVNPCTRLPELTSAETMSLYPGRLLGDGRPPHLYAVAEEAYRLLLKTGEHQGLVISGCACPSELALRRPPTLTLPRTHGPHTDPTRGPTHGPTWGPHSLTRALTVRCFAACVSASPARARPKRTRC
jgi:hypothetical protein